MNPTSRFPPLWHRRAASVVLFVSTFTLGFSLYNAFHDLSAKISLIVLISLFLPLCSAVGALLSVLPSPDKLSSWLSFISYCLIIAGLGVLLVIAGSYSLHVIFIVLFGILVGIGGIFGPLAWIGTTGFVVWYLALYFVLESKNYPLSTSITNVIIYVAPLIASWLLWRNGYRRPTTEADASYSSLAVQLTQVANKSEIVINAINDGVIALDGKGTIQLINPAAQSALGWDQRDALGLDYHSIIKMQDMQGKPLEEALNPIAQALHLGTSIQKDNILLQTGSGKTFQTSLQVSSVGQLGSGSGVIAVFRDITVEKAQEREQAEFISTASHEMRTPVAAIEGYLGLALNPSTAQIDEKARTYLQKAHESAQHLGRLFQDLLDVSKADDGRLRNNPRVVDMVSFSRDITESMRSMAEDKKLQLVFQVAQNPNMSEHRVAPVFYTEVDKDHLREVLANLIENAIKYTPTGTVAVDVTGDQDNIQVIISDTGIGIPPEDISHLFQKFYRVDNSNTREIGGTGLGLYLSRRLVELMGGKIWVESEYQKGSRFYVSLPRLSHEVATARLQAMAEEQARNEATEATKH